jgi:hypothetical protein
MDRNASVLWKGNLHESEGTLTTESGVLSETQMKTTIEPLYLVSLGGSAGIPIA